MATSLQTRSWKSAVRVFMVGAAGLSCLASAIEPIPLGWPEATSHSGGPESLGAVVDGVEAGPSGWTVAPKVSENQSLVVRCLRPVEAAELDFELFFMSGRPFSTIAEFSLSFTTDEIPSLQGNWTPLDVQRFSAEVSTLLRTNNGRLRSDPIPYGTTGKIRDEVYRVEALLPGGRATGFRLDAFPVRTDPSQPACLSWYEPWDFTLTEFRVSRHIRPSTNIALHRPVTASHPLYGAPVEIMKAEALTDGLPATIAHPQDENLGAAFHFQIDLGRIAELDHIGLRNRGDVGLDRLSRMMLRLHDEDPETGAPPVWEGIDRADGSHPAAGEVDILRAEMGKGVFRGRYIRISSDNPVPLSPQLAEVEVYEKRVPEVVAAFADGKEIPVAGRLILPPGVRRISLQIRIRQEGMPAGILFRWRMRGDLDEWQNSRLMTLDMPCPRSGDSVFETQALHSDGQWDATVFRLPVTVRVFYWETPAFRYLAGAAGLLSALVLGLFVARRRAKLQLERLRLATALANERARIAQDLHDDLGAELSSIAMLADLARQDVAPPQNQSPERAVTSRLDEITSHAKQTVRRLEEIVWAVNPANDTLEGFARFFCKFAQGYLELAAVASRFDVPDSFPAHSLTAGRRHHLFLAGKEAVHNAVRHGSPTRVIIRMELRDGAFHLIIEDDGRGFDATPASPASHGSANMAHRMLAIGGNFERDSQPGTGTVVRFSIPLGTPPT